jgi:maltoporin
MNHPADFPGLRGLKCTLALSLTVLTTGALFAQSADQSDVSALKSQMEKMQRQYEQRISAMEAQMKSLESKADSGSILNTRILTDSDGKGGPPAPVLTEDFLKSLTRNFVFNMYVRAGFMFNGNGGQGLQFVIPDNIGGEFRLGNEPDFYMEPTFIQNHILGDGPDVADVSFRFTPNLYDHIERFSFLTTGTTTGGGNGFNVGIRETFAEMKNVFKGAPEITFWGGERFYDRYNIDPDDLFWLDSSGWGAGVYNIDLFCGKLYLAWLGGTRDNLNLNNTSNVFNRVGNQFQQTFDVRLKEIPFLCGKLALIGIGTYMKGATIKQAPGTGTFTDSLGVPFNGVLSTGDAWGGGGGIIWQYDFGNKSFFRLFALASKGNLFFSGVTDPSNIQGNIVNAFEAGVARLRNGRTHLGVTQTGPDFFVGQLSTQNHTTDYRAGVDLGWNVTPCFSVLAWAYWDNNNQGFGELREPHRALGTGPGDLVVGGGSRNLVGVGIRPILWIWDDFAIQGQAGYNYIDNNRSAGNGLSSLGRGGSFGIFTIAPTIKPVGGYGTRPEIRFFATYAIWSHSLAQGAVVSAGNNASSSPPYNGNANQGWTFGTQMEIGF